MIMESCKACKVKARSMTEVPLPVWYKGGKSGCFLDRNYFICAFSWFDLWIPQWMMGIHITSNKVVLFRQCNITEPHCDGVEVTWAFMFIVNIEDCDWCNWRCWYVKDLNIRVVAEVRTWGEFAIRVVFGHIGNYPIVSS
jgi:hypothetical protein